MGGMLRQFWWGCNQERLMKILVAVVLLVCGLAGWTHAQTALTYQKPPAAIEELLEAPLTPVVKSSPDRSRLLVVQPQSFPTIAEVAQPRYRLAGIRFNPATNGPSREVSIVKLWLQSVAGGAQQPIAGLPAVLKASHPTWSPDSRHVAFVQKETTGIELWVVDVANSSAHRLGLVKLNAVLGEPCQWMADSQALLCKIVPAARGSAPAPSEVPAGPNVEENLGKVTPARTYEDLLKTPADEAVFAFYATSDLALVSLDGTALELPVNGLITQAQPSPDGRFAFFEELHRPFSYALPAENFPAKVSVVTLKTGVIKDLSDHPLLDAIPIAFDAVPVGPRDYVWRSDAPAELVWTEARDGGDPKVKATVRDRLMGLTAPFEGQGEVLLDSPMRIRSVEWGHEHLALATEWRWSDRQIAMVAFDPSSHNAKLVTLYAGSSQDRYHSPGRPVSQTNTRGMPALQLTRDGKGIYFFSLGATPQGDLPFVGVMPVGGGSEQIQWRSAMQMYAEPIAILSADKVLVRQESQSIPPNYFVTTLSQRSGAQAPMKQVTNFPSPYAGIQLPTKQLLKYSRADGLELTATLWLPAGYDKSRGPLPTLMEAYPAEFKTRAAAGQVSGSPFRFPRIGWGSPVFLAQAGYAVLENASIPIVGEGDAQPNDTYVEQLVAGAKAAIDAGAALGVVDVKRVAVMGHSYGAFMTANLLAHSDMFRAGIARSGAYNRTLTPFGFQAEERTYWEAPEVYFKMSPFSFADKIKTPILLMHGEADDNQGTFPIQSERFYVALKGHGATVRLVFLPLEAHGYEAHESLSHMLWEMNRWLDTYVKPAEPVN
jgi:dipeptidyl aminopeptidase/acylaminoacyl peptidase